ncbi:MAG: hypothetical protein K6C97_11650 [Treponema sp.]|nr:hypothetical protein [Treponema sp.]
MMKKIKPKYSKKLFSNAFIYRFFMTLDITFTVFCIILSILYVIGNYQSFQDSSQKLIISVASLSATFNLLLSIILTIETIFKLFTEHHKIKHIMNILFLLLTIVFCFACMELSSIITYLSTGIK